MSQSENQSESQPKIQSYRFNIPLDKFPSPDINIAQFKFELSENGFNGENICYISSESINIISDVNYDINELYKIAEKHDNTQNKPYLTKTININKVIDTNIYYKVSDIIFAGEISEGNIEKIDFISFINNSKYNYSIRIVDCTNHKIITELTNQNNVNQEIIEFKDINNVPRTKTIIELHAKVSDPNAFLTIDSLTFYF